MSQPNASDQFTMIYQSILSSSIAENYELRHFFEDMLKLADWRTGIVDMTPGAISRMINLPLDKVNGFIAELEKPDDDDKSGNYSGCRIIRLDTHRNWGWTIVNYQCYRATRTAEERREYNRVKQAERRARIKAESEGNHLYRASAENRPAATPPPPLTNQNFDTFWSAYPRKTAKAGAEKAWKKVGADALIDRILAALAVQSKSDAWRTDGGQFIPHPATWLNGKRWEDEIPLNGISPKPQPRQNMI